ncbi:Xylose isomerase-like TIM barrel [Aquisphaera giovannonii]|uniref:Xylose isomerase-like TIM barrel n=1 Tax=Aquisphaera giovannonii TaxID=406548 RepID=A0A5B9VW03_9BACT|nr:TIM barrel protein [Aquisphaera giovannonii]QEH32636.1 Xylose isomerase-like TIM barrel [Aquisphaera giovannonii]
MIRHPLGLRLNPDRSIRDQIQEAARLGARGVVLDAIGDLAPQRLGETGRRELGYLFRTLELSLVAVSLPTRRAFDTIDQLEDRLRRADSAFAMAYELGTNLVLARVGPVPPADEPARREAFDNAVGSLGRAADHRGVRLAIETEAEPGKRLKDFLEALDLVGLAASVDPANLLRAGIDPATAVAELGSWVAHAYAGGSSPATSALAHPRGFGSSASAIDWESYLGSLEEVGYRGFLTIWPDPAADARTAFNAISGRLKQVS